MRQILLLPAILLSANLFAQKIDSVSILNNERTGTYYLALVPVQQSKGLLVILGGFSTPRQTFLETNLPAKACAAGFTVVLPFLYRADLVDRNNIFQARLESLLPELIRKYNIPKNKFIIGGHSWAGHQAMFYTERAYDPIYKPIVKPNLVFAVDPPLDLKRLYNEYDRVLAVGPAKKKNEEAQMITSLFKDQFGGTPQQKPKAYELASSYYREAKDGGNVKYLSTVPVRLYSDPDINWFITKRNTPVEWTNLADISACIVQLRLLGNNNAEYISCLGKGYLPNHERHPHAFSMLDADEFIIWAEKMLSRK